MKPSVRSSIALCLLCLFAPALPARAQTPNTATVTVVVLDQTGAAVKDAKVTIINNSTGAGRDAMSGVAGSATTSGLPVGGLYGPGRQAGLHGGRRHQPDAARRRIGYRAREARRQRWQERSHGLRHESGRPFGFADRPAPRQQDDRRDADPRTQDHDAAAAQLRIPPGQGHGRSVRQCDVLHHRRRQPPHHDVHARRRDGRRRVGTSNGVDHGAGRGGAGSRRAHERFQRRVRMDRWPGDEYRHQVRHEHSTAKGLHGPLATVNRARSRQRASAAFDSVASCRRADGDQSVDIGHPEQCSARQADV